MSSIRVSTISTALIALCLTFITFAQNNKSAGNDGKSGGQVEVETDRFSGNVTVTMKPQTLIDTPELQLTIELKYRLDKKKLEESPILVEELTALSPATLAAIRDFAREFAAHAPTRSNRKGAKQ